MVRIEIHLPKGESARFERDPVIRINGQSDTAMARLELDRAYRDACAWLESEGGRD